MRTKLPRVALFIETSRTYGRGILRGIAHYAHVHGPWSFFAEERELRSGIPDRLQSWNVDGIIARIEGKRTAGISFAFRLPGGGRAGQRPVQRHSGI